MRVKKILARAAQDMQQPRARGKQVLASDD